MSPIIDLQRRMVEVGRIRMGHQVAAGRGKRPAKLENWRLTSRDSSRLDAAAELYGGSVSPWEDRPGEFELFTTTAELPILLLPGQTLSQWYELWSAGGCARRCDGDRDVISEGPCICDQETGDRACKPTTRLSVMLPDVPGLGCWRLESHGYYAAVELAGTAAMLEQATARGQLLPARLRIDQRAKVEGGKTTRYAVPVIDIDVTMRQALPGAVAQPYLPGYAPTTATAPDVSAFVPLQLRTGGVTLEEGLAAVNREAEPKTRNGRQQAPLGPSADELLETSPEPIPIGDEPAEPEPDAISDLQRTLLWATVRDAGIPEDVLRDVVNEITGQTSTKLIPPSRFDQVLKTVEALALGEEIVRLASARGVGEKATAMIQANRELVSLAEHVAWLKSQRDKAAATTEATT